MGALEYIIDNPGRLIEMGIEHALLVLVAVAAAGLVGVGLGVATYRRPVAASMAAAVCATMLTIPSFALFGLMLAWVGLGNTGVVIALVAYGLLPIVRNTITGLQGVDPAITESAKGMGMSGWQVLLRIELPLAWPVIIAGLRVATMLVVSILAIGAYIGADGLGNEIFRALSNIGSVWALDVAIAATIAIVAVALVLELFWVIVDRLTTPRGLR